MKVKFLISGCQAGVLMSRRELRSHCQYSGSSQNSVAPSYKMGLTTDCSIVSEVTRFNLVNLED